MPSSPPVLESFTTGLKRGCLGTVPQRGGCRALRPAASHVHDRSRMAEFTPLDRQPSLAAQVTTQMLAAIFSGSSAVGEELPSERELSVQFGVSRTVIREALRALQAKGVVEVQTGRAAR